MSDNIPGVVLGTLARFRDLSGAAQNSKNESLRLFLPSKIDDELARFKVWSGNSGAHRSGRASLDHRLRDASGVRRQVLRLLDDLQEILEEALSLVTEQEASRDEIALDEGVPGGADVEKDMELVALDITDVVDCLLRLSVAIKNPAPHDRIKASGMEASVYEPFDIQHVRGKFGLLDDDLSQRLGRAISRRREFFKYREAHNKKLSYGLDLHQDTNNTEIVASTVASSIPGHMKEQANCCIQDEEDVHSVAGASQTSYATSVASNQTLRIPPMPADALRGPFQCPFCFMIVSIRDTAAWKKHVYDDLRPYNCLAKVCIASDQDFASRNDWMKHMLQYHLRIYRCPYECEETFGQAEDSRRHLEKAHPEVIPDNQVDELVNRSSRPLPPDTKVSCPFCLENLESLKQYRQHVGRHQQDLALFALPSTVFRDDDSEEDNAVLHDDGDDSSSPGDDHQETAPDSDVSRRLARLYFMTSLNTFLHARGMTDEVYALGKGYIINGRFVDLYHLYLAVEAEGGYDEATMGYRWSAVASAVGLDCQNDDLMTLKSMYDRLLLEFERSEHHEPLSAARKQQHFSPSTSHQSELTESRSRFLQNLPNLTCPDCGARCKTESELKEHDKRHPKGYCGAPGCTRKEGFRTVDGLNRHLSSVHPGYFPGPRYRCTVGKCPTKDNTWFTPYDLQQHLEGVHGMLIPSFANLKPFMYTSTSAEDTAPSNTVTTSNAEDQAQPPALSSPESDIKDWKQYIHIPYTVAEDSELAEMKKKLDKLFGEGNHHLEQTESKKLILNLTRQLTRIEIAELTTHLTGKGWGTDEAGSGAGQRTGHDACNPG